MIWKSTKETDEEKGFVYNPCTTDEGFIYNP